MTQTQQILEHLQLGKTITPIEALNLYGSFRLGARILEIRKQGYNVITNIKSQGKKHFAEYSLND
jgi:hypothetical protein